MITCLRLDRAHQVFHHQRGIGEQRPAGGVDDFDLGQRLGVDPVHQPGELQRLARRDAVIVHDVERIAGLPHVQPRQRAPGAADRIEGAALAVVQHVEVFERLLDDFLRLLERLAGDVLQARGRRAAASCRRARALPCTSTSSSEPPPRSPTMPSGLWMPDTMPSAVRWASRLPDRIVIGVRQMRSASAMKARPLRASRQAAVAIAQMLAHVQRVAQRAEALERVERDVDRVGRQQAGRSAPGGRGRPAPFR